MANISGGAKKVLKAKSNEEILSYILNINPELREGVGGLPRQGTDDVQRIGDLIVNTQRYRNLFVNTINLIGLIVIDRNGWDDAWDFTERGSLNFGDSVEEIMLDLANVYDWNQAYDDKMRFLQTQAPNVYSYLHHLNFQKFYETTTNDALTSMSFYDEGGLFDFVDKSIGMLWESYKYDSFLINKYMIQRRLLTGSITSVEITNFDNLTPRQRVSFMKNYSNRMSFRSPNFNPAGIRLATNFSEQIIILSSKFESDFSTDVLATSYFRDEAEYRARAVLIDTFSTTDKARLQELLRDEYIETTAEEEAALDNIPAIIISREWFRNYTYNIGIEGDGTRMTEFYNPVTHDNNHFLTVFAVKSTSPFENAVVFTINNIQSVVSVNVSGAQKADNTVANNFTYLANVVTTGFANQAVVWKMDVVTGFAPPAGVVNKTNITQDGVLHYIPYKDPSNPSGFGSGVLKITATSVFDSTKSASVEIDLTD